VTLEESFEGTSSGDEEIRQVCLHEEDAWDVEPRQSIDFDALLAFTRTLGAFRRGFRYCLAKGVKYQIRYDLHVQRHVYWVDEKDRP
jgi:hypothetical protein